MLAQCPYGPDYGQRIDLPGYSKFTAQTRKAILSRSSPSAQRSATILTLNRRGRSRSKLKVSSSKPLSRGLSRVRACFFVLAMTIGE